MRPQIDLDAMTDLELRDLNREIVERLQMRASIRNKSRLMAFRIGDRVAFETDQGTVEGVVTRVNQKTVSVESDDRRGWRVSPGLLSKVAKEVKALETAPNLFSFASHKGQAQQ